MIRHVVLFTFDPSTTAAQIAALRERLAALPSQIPEIVAYHFGDDLGVNDGNNAFAVTADFATVDDYRTYRDAPVHLTLIDEVVKPIVATRAAVQFEM